MHHGYFAKAFNVAVNYDNNRENRLTKSTGLKLVQEMGRRISTIVFQRLT